MIKKRFCGKSADKPKDPKATVTQSPEMSTESNSASSRSGRGSIKLGLEAESSKSSKSSKHPKK